MRQKGGAEEYYFEKDDALNLGGFAAYLRCLVQNHASYRRPGDADSYVIALDAPWGTGKTRFLRMFKNHLQGCTPNAPGGGDAFSVLYYDAWKSDFWDNAFEPLADSILKNKLFFEGVLDGHDAKLESETMAEVLALAGTVAKGLASRPFAALLGDGYAKALFDRVGKRAKAETEAPRLFPAYNDFKTSIEKLQWHMAQEMQHKAPNTTLVVVVDELDRCKPTFAVQTLEIIKHILNVRNIVFLVAVDMGQLAHSVAKVYGQGIDAQGYLLRLFNQYCQLPKPPVESYVALRAQQMEAFPDDVLGHIVFGLGQLAAGWQLSLRDVDTVLAAYRVFYDMWAHRYASHCAHTLYLFFITLKYKRPDVYDAFIRTGNAGPIEAMGLPFTRYFPDIVDCSGQRLAIVQNRGEQGKRECIANVLFELLRSNEMLCNLDVLLIRQRGSEELTHRNSMRRVCEAVARTENDEMYVYSGLLFPQDAAHLGKAELAPRMYLHHQLEFFNFAPTGE